ncbi:unnamed protein product, partial [Ranitomeya imitator]
MSSVVPNVSWADRMSSNVMRDGNRSTSLTVYEVPVLYSIHVISRSLEDSTKYVPFVRVNETAKATHRYQIKNLGLGAVLIDLSVHVSYVEAVSWDITISFSQNNGVNCSAPNDSYAVKTHSKEHETNQEQTSVSVSSAVMIHYNESRYHSAMGSRFHTAKCGFFRRYKDRMMENVPPSDVTAQEPLENQSEQESDHKQKLLQDFLVDPLNGMMFYPKMY